MTTFINEIEKTFNTKVTTNDHLWDKHSTLLLFQVGGHEVTCVFGKPYEGEHSRRLEYVCNTYIKTPELKIKERQSQNTGKTPAELVKKVIKYLSKYNA